MESLIRESDLRRMVIKMREKETCMETVTAAYVPTHEDFRLKSNPGEIGNDKNFVPYQSKELCVYFQEMMPDIPAPAH